MYSTKNSFLQLGHTTVSVLIVAELCAGNTVFPIIIIDREIDNIQKGILGMMVYLASDVVGHNLRRTMSPLLKKLYMNSVGLTLIGIGLILCNPKAIPTLRTTNSMI